MKHISSALFVATALVSTGALAESGTSQPQAPAKNAQAPAIQSGRQTSDSTHVRYITTDRPDLWRASKLDGVAVYNQNNENIGTINDVLIDRQGRAEAVVIGVGGFLGMGEHNVAVPFSSLQWAMHTDKNGRSVTAPSAAGTNHAAPQPQTAANAPATTSAQTGTDRDYPDRAILPSASKDELTKAPQFNYAH